MRRERSGGDSSLLWVIGRNSVREALRHRSNEIVCVYAQRAGGDATLTELIEQAKRQGVDLELVERGQLDRLLRNDSHQGIACSLPNSQGLSLPDFLETLEPQTSSLVVLLDEIEDPHNLGAILRACECFGVDGLVWSKNRGAGLSPTVSKTSAGASLLVPTVLVSNVADALRKFKDAGWWAVGSERREGSQALPGFEFPAKTVLVLGSEGSGIRPVLQKQLDFSVSIPQWGKLDSLNVSQATAVMLYAARLQSTK